MDKDLSQANITILFSLRCAHPVSRMAASHTKLAASFLLVTMTQS